MRVDRIYKPIPQNSRDHLPSICENFRILEQRNTFDDQSHT
jgi:hypothetical protein